MTLDAIEMQGADAPGASLIVLHGLGADGNDFVPIAQELDLSAVGGARFVFPHAPMRPVTMNGGYVMRAWYDIAGTPQTRREDETGLRESQALIEALIAREVRTRHAGLAHRADGLFARLRDDPADRAAPRRAAGRPGGPVGLPAAGGPAPPPSARRPMPTCRSSWRTGARTR